MRLTNAIHHIKYRHGMSTTDLPQPSFQTLPSYYSQAQRNILVPDFESRGQCFFDQHPDLLSQGFRVVAYILALKIAVHPPPVSFPHFLFTWGWSVPCHSSKAIVDSAPVFEDQKPIQTRIQEGIRRKIFLEDSRQVEKCVL